MFMFRGIEITSDNYLFLSNYAGPYADITLQATVEFSQGGYARAAKALLLVPEHMRNVIDSEARIKTNVLGGQYADSVEVEVAIYLNGNREFPYTQANLDMLTRERTSHV